MPLLGTRGAASARGFGFLAKTGIGGPYWMGTLSGGSDVRAYACTVDSSGNFYVTGYSTTSEVLIAKYNNSGTIQWQRNIGGADTNIDFGAGIAVDSSGNVYVNGYTQNATTSYDLLIVKYNSSGTLQWQRTLAGPSTGGDYGYGCAVDSSGNVYITGFTNSAGAGSNDILIAKYNTSGTLQWQRTLGSGSSDVGYGIAVDSSGNVYVSGASGSSPNIVITKYNTSGTIQWQNFLGNGVTTGNDLSWGSAVDSSGNVYITGYTQATSNLLVAKYDTSGAYQWQRIFNTASTEGDGIAVDLSGNVYIIGLDNSGAAALILAKYNTSGTIQWQRRISVSGGGLPGSPKGISVDISGNIYIASYASPLPTKIFIAKLPSDGSKTGTYTVGGASYTYATSSFTDAAGSLPRSTGTLTDAAGTLTSSSSTLTEVASTLTSSTTTI
jgi:uncharacterized delta-60 repeat protein